MWICDSAVLGLLTISLLLAIPNIVVRPPLARNLGRPRHAIIPCSPKTLWLYLQENYSQMRPYRLKQLSIRLEFCDGNAANLRATF
jgi:hypothetical protein